MPVDKDQHILKDELICLSGKKAVKVGIDQLTLRRIVVYDSFQRCTIRAHHTAVRMGRIHYRSIKQSKMGCRNIFQTSETKLVSKNIYRHKRKCGKVSDLYRSHYLTIFRINKTLYRKRGAGFQ